MTKQDVTISCPHCLREYSLSLDLERLTRIRKQAVCARCKQSFDVGARVVVREGATRSRAPRRSAPAIAAIRPGDLAGAGRRPAVTREEVLSPRRGHEDFSAPRPGAVSSAPPVPISRWQPMSRPSPAPLVQAGAKGVDRWRPVPPDAATSRLSAVARAAFEDAVSERAATDQRASERATPQRGVARATARPPRPSPAPQQGGGETPIGTARTLPMPSSDWLVRADGGLGPLVCPSAPPLDALELLLSSTG